MLFPEVPTGCQCTEERLSLEESFEGTTPVDRTSPKQTNPRVWSKTNTQDPSSFHRSAQHCSLQLLTHKPRPPPPHCPVSHCQWLPLPCSLETDHNHLASRASLSYSCCITPGTWARGQQRSSQVKHRASQAVRISTSHSVLFKTSCSQTAGKFLLPVKE